MTQHDVQALLISLQQDHAVKAELIETHISYVILTSHHAYKIKKPMKYSFLDFSTPEARKFYCNRELELNQRLEPEVYRDVVPIRHLDKDWYIGGTRGAIADHAVVMKRLNSKLQMDVLLRQKQVSIQQIEQVAQKVARFHQGAIVIGNKPDITDEYIEDFEDIHSVRDSVGRHLGGRYAKILEEVVSKSRTYLDRNRSFIQSRVSDGFIRDVHGDLHARNIFLYDPPIIFDCIEFNDHFRQIDVLSEIGFLMMDLEAANEQQLATCFLYSYLSHFEAIHNQRDRALLLFFKTYRANVRAKVNALRLISEEIGYDRQELIFEIRKYLKLMDQYVYQLDGQ